MRLTPLLVKRQNYTGLLRAGVVVMFCLLTISLVAQQGDRTSQLTGKTRQVTPVPNGTVNAGPVNFKKDSDNDGMPDEDEQANGTNPNDPSDADADNDGDGVSNGDEVALGSNPNATDSDGDGVSDGDELRLGYDPTDPNSTPGSGAALTSLQISPASVNISVNSLLGQKPVQLRITGVRSDNTTVDLTGSSTLTFQSFATGIALVDDFGLVVGIDTGTTSVRVQSGAVFADVSVVITTITPSRLSALNIPGFANNVDVAGNYAYVAAGAAGLVVVDVTDRSNPAIIATLDTPGNANDVRVVGSLAYIADGSSGLEIIDIATPASPAIVGSLDTPGDASDVVVYGTRAYVADGFAGLRIVDVSNPSTPTSLSFVPSSGGAVSGVDVSGDLAVVTDSRSIRIIDLAVPTAPTVVGSVTLPTGAALDLVVHNRFAYVATFGQGLLIVDFSTPTAPQIIDRESGFNLNDVAVTNQFAVVAESVFPNFVPIFDLDDPGNAIFRSALNPLSGGAIQGTGIALTDQHIYMTGSNGSAPNNGVSGTTQLFIFRYQEAAPPVSDTAGNAPSVTINAPQNGQSITAGDQLPISITATDDVQVASVQLIVNGVVVIEDGVAPYDISYTAPHNVSSLVIEAKAFDAAGNSATSPPVTINVLPDPPPTIDFITPAEGQVLTEEQTIFLAADANDNRTVANVAITVNGQSFANFSFFTVPRFVSSLTFTATATDDFGQTTSTTRVVTVIPDPPPTISIVSPPEGTELVQGQVVEFVADASDNIFVNHVDFTINSQVFTDSQSPFRQSYTIPAGITSLFLEAAAVDNLGQRTAATRTFTVVTELGTTVTGQVRDTSAQPVPGATAKVGQLTGISGADGRFTIPNVPIAQGDILVRVNATLAGQSAANASLPKPGVPSGTTDVGVITLSISPTAPTAFAVADYNSDFVPDVFAGYPERQSLLYSFSGGQFTPSASLLLPYGALRSGANLDSNFGNRHQIFAQLAGRPGSVTELTFENAAMQSPTTISTGLSGESEYTAAGLDTSGPSNNRPVLAFLQNGSGATSLAVRFGTGAVQGYTSPIFPPVDPAAPLRTLTLSDVNNDGLPDLLVVKPLSGTAAKLVVYLRTSATTFGAPIETTIAVRATVPASGAVDFVLGSLAGGDSIKDIAVLGDDRVRVYQGDGIGGFVFVREVLITAGRIATGLTAFDVSADGRSDLLVTTRSTTTPTAKDLRVYLNTFSGTFLSPTITSYTGPLSSGDTRIGPGKWGGNFQRFDAVVLESDDVRIFLDIGPTSGGGS